MNIELDYIKSLISMASENELTELRITSGEKEILIKKEKEVQVAHSVAPMQMVQAPVAMTESQSENIAVTETQEAKPASVAPIKGTPVVSPIVGTFYSSPSPDADAYVKVGDTVKVGQVLCIIESMKLMNEIESEVAGKIVEICVDNAEAVESGAVLMYIE